jgi:hypothetical protein
MDFTHLGCLDGIDLGPCPPPRGLRFDHLRCQFEWINLASSKKKKTMDFSEGQIDRKHEFKYFFLLKQNDIHSFKLIEYIRYKHR